MSVQAGLIADGKVWLEMVDSRIETVHGYDQATAGHIVSGILNSYHALFEAFERTMEQKRSGNQGELFQ